MIQGDCNDTLMRRALAKEYLEPDLPHGGRRVLKLERGLYVIRERRDDSAETVRRGIAAREKRRGSREEF